MRYRVTLKQLTDGDFYARCLAAPNGPAAAQAATAEEALARLRQEIRYRLEYCPCSAVSGEYVELEVENAGARPQA